MVDHSAQHQGPECAWALQDFNPSQDLYDVQFGFGGVGDSEVPGMSADYGMGSGNEGWELDYQEGELQEGEIAECEGQEVEWWFAPMGIQVVQGSADQRKSLGVLQTGTSTKTALVTSDRSDLRPASRRSASVQALVLRPGKRSMEKDKELMKGVRAPLATEKTVGPVQVITFLGIELDSVLMEIRLLEDKKQRCLEHLNQMLEKGKVEVRHTAFTKPFERCLPGLPSIAIDWALTGKVLPHHWVRISARLKKDLRLWRVLLNDCNGILLAGLGEQFE
ncbi:hypothetical protein NDU88_006739 [Pleurodeles waltl]|uniref:Uncharacterized protein n=1 Tax=Pleurodeles waltl TaxID=8319 RepID=A0AAV7NVZ2_PLEWA|nr:hypothetical protein NDU88_006739 [Pleurodeles waltl]